MNETFRDEKVTYAFEVQGRFVLVENVPARFSVETGERLFSPETVERLHRVIWGSAHAKRIIETPVYQFA